MLVERVDAPENTEITLAHWGPAGAGAPRVVLVHGLGGSALRPYMLRAARHFLRLGYGVTAVGLRRDSVGRPVYHLGLREDLEQALERESLQASALFLLGFSGGGSVVLNFLAKHAGAGRVRAAACMSAPLDLLSLGRYVETRIPFYHRHLLRGLSGGQASHFESLRAYDAAVLCRRYGFRDVDDYRARMSAGPQLSRVAVPTLLLEAEDDPVVPAGLNSQAITTLPACIERVVTRRGGHIGWVQSASELHTADSWGLRRVASFFAASR